MTNILTTYLFFSLFLQFAFAQQKIEFNYPDLIPVLVNDSLYGYADKDLNLKIEARFEYAELFEEDFQFQIFHVLNPEIIHYGTAEYAWAKINGERFRINKKGEPVYKYNPDDFKSGETLINLFMKESDAYVVDSLDSKTLFQYITDSNTGQSVFPDEEFLKELNENAKEWIQEGVELVFYPKFEELPFTYFMSEETFLRGIKNTETGEIVIKARYEMIEELYNNNLRIRQYPLIIVFDGSREKTIYVSLEGTEY